MTFDGIKDMRIGSKKVMSAWLDGKQIYPDAKRILDSLILWVDPKKQQATNESMAKNPKLIDLSGNGHDATCYNFAWSGMSGIGGYTTDFTNGYPVYVTVIERTYKLIHCTTTGTNCWPWHHEGDDFSVEPFSAKISGLNGQPLIYYYYDGTIRKQINITSDGVYDFPESILVLDNTKKIYLGFYIPANEQSLNVTIEQLPLYPNALVSDGVDDYAKVTGLPILTKERGYTIISKRNLLNYNDGKNGMLVSKQHGDISLNICVEQFTSSSITNNIAYCRSFGKYLSFPLDSIDKSFSVQTSKKYNGMQYKGEATTSDTPYLFLFSSGTGWNLKSVLYSFLLFDRDLTEEEIEWVKENMVEADGVMMYDWMDKNLFNNWIEDGTRATGSINSNKIVITGLVMPNIRFFETKGADAKVINSYKIKVTGVSDNIHILYSGQVNGTETIFLEISQDGVYTLPQVEGTTIGFKCRIIDNNVDTPINITIQQLITSWDQPLDSSLVDAWIFSGHTNEEAPYQIAGEKGINLRCYNFAWNDEGSGFKDGALHFDGVDDNLSCLNIHGEIPELDDYTVICRRYVTPGKNSCTASKAPYLNHNGAFIFELKEGTDIKTYSFTVGTSIDDFAGKESVSWQTKSSYNGLELVSGDIGSETDDFHIGIYTHFGNTYLDGYVKYFALYDRTLSVNEIQAEIRKLDYKWEKRLNNK